MAADWPLRGSVAPSYARWDGWQAGVQVGYGNLNTDFGDSTSPLVAFILRNSTLENEAQPSSWTALPRNSTNGPVFGGFVGYNVQWSELVLGADLAYMHPSVLQSSVSDSISRTVTTSDTVTHNVNITAQSAFKLVDYATLRARAGYAFDQFLPYAAVGIAVGRFNYGTTVTVTDDFSILPAPTVRFQQSASSGQNNVFVAGVAAAPRPRLGGHAQRISSRRMAIYRLRTGKPDPFKRSDRAGRRRIAILVTAPQLKLPLFLPKS